MRVMVNGSLSCVGDGEWISLLCESDGEWISLLCESDGEWISLLCESDGEWISLLCESDVKQETIGPRLMVNVSNVFLYLCNSESQ